jgi:hypothetical protein
MIRTRLRDGHLHEIHRGVYLVGHRAPPPHAHEMAAVPVCPGAVLSHSSAAHLWELLPYPAAAPVWVTLEPERSVRRHLESGPNEQYSATATSATVTACR